MQWRRLDLDAVDKQWVISLHTQVADRPSALRIDGGLLRSRRLENGAKLADGIASSHMMVPVLCESLVTRPHPATTATSYEAAVADQPEREEEGPEVPDLMMHFDSRDCKVSAKHPSSACPAYGKRGP
jgi:hypothetical protein